MLRYIATRLVQAVGVVLAVATLTFVLLHLAPGDPLSGVVEGRNVSPEVVQQMRRNLGLDQPLHIQYARYLANIIRGDFGVSFSLRRPVLDAILEALPNTLVLAGAALIIDFVLGIAIGTFQGARPGSRLDHSISTTTLALYSIPGFWFGVMLLLVFGQILGWFPVGGGGDPLMSRFYSAPQRLADLLWHLTLPALTLGLVSAAGTARYQRAALVDISTQDFIRTARAKGLRERRVLLRHMLRNALLPTITLFGLSLPVLLSGTVLTETVFAWPGMGRLSVNAVFRRDYPLVTGAAILAATMVVVGNLVADVLYRVADPRTRSWK